MGIRKELERLEAEEQAKQERIEQEKLVIIGKIKERLDFLNKEARALARPHLQVLQQSGAIDVLRELKEAAERRDEVKIFTTISYRCPVDISKRKRLERRGTLFEGEDLAIREFPNFGDDDCYLFKEYSKSTEEEFYRNLLAEHNPYFLGELKAFIKHFSLIKPDDFKVNNCFVELGCYHKVWSPGGLYEWCGDEFKNKTLVFCSLWPDKAVKLVKVEDDLEPSEFLYTPYPHYPGEGVDLFYFPERKWGDRALLEKTVAQACYDLWEEK